MEKMTLLQLADQFQEAEMQVLGNTIQLRKDKIRSIRKRLRDKDLTLVNARIIQKEIKILISNITTLLDDVNPWLNFHVEGNSEYAKNHLRDFTDQLTVFKDECETTIEILKSTETAILIIT